MVRCVRMQGRAVHERGGHRESLLCRIPVSSRGHAVAPFDREETRQAWPLLTFLTCLRRIFLGALPQNTIAGDTPRAEQQLDRATWPRLADVLAVGFRTRTRDEWTATFLGTDACCVPVLEPLEVDDAGRGPNESGVGAGNADSSLIGYPSPAPRLGRTPATAPAKGNIFLRPGCDSADVLSQAGFGAEEVQALVKQGAVGASGDKSRL